MDVVARLLWGWDARIHAPDMFGKVVVITGANSGLGYETTLRLAERRATIIMGVRNLAAGNRAAEAIRHAVGKSARLLVWHVDMASFTSVTAFASRVAAAFPAGVDVLVNNAGVLNPPGMAQPVTHDGIEVTRAVNFFGPALLTHQLLPSLAAAAPSRVVNMSSLGEAIGRIKWSDLTGARAPQPVADFQAYADSKLMMILWSQELHRRLQGAGIDVFSVHPGVVHTPGEWKASGLRPTSWLTWLGGVLHGQTAAWGATSILYAATDSRLASRGGVYIGPRYLQAFGYAGSNTAIRSPLNPAARNAAAAHRLFDETTAILLERASAAAAPAGAEEASAGGGGTTAGTAALPSPDAIAAAAAKDLGPLVAAGAPGADSGGDVARMLATVIEGMATFEPGVGPAATGGCGMLGDAVGVRGSAVGAGELLAAAEFAEQLVEAVEGEIATAGI